MGTPLPPNEPNPQCTACFGPGKIFGDAPSPRFLILQFQGFIPDQAWDPDNEIVLLAPQHLLQQINPCIYQLQVGPLLFYWRWFTYSTMCSIEDTVAAVEYFRGDVTDPCELIVENELTTGIGVGSLGGIVTVGWNPEDI